jgi:hypothetical protein
MTFLLKTKKFLKIISEGFFILKKYILPKASMTHFCSKQGGSLSPQAVGIRVNRVQQ